MYYYVYRITHVVNKNITMENVKVKYYLKKI